MDKKRMVFHTILFFICIIHIPIDIVFSFHYTKNRFVI